MNAAVDAKKSKVTVKEESAGEQQTVEVSQEGGPGAEGQPAAGAGSGVAPPGSCGAPTPATRSRTCRPERRMANWRFIEWQRSSGRWPGNQNASDWEGFDGPERPGLVDVTVGGTTTTLTRDVVVTARPWTETRRAIPLGRAGNGTLPAQPSRAGRSGHHDSSTPAGHVASPTVKSGPNEGFHFLVQPPMAWNVQAHSNEALYGPHAPVRPRARANAVAGRSSRSLGALQLDVEAHEGHRASAGAGASDFREPLAGGR